LASVGDPERSTYHVGWVFMKRYTKHMSYMFQEVMTTGTYQRLHLEEYDHQVSAKNRLMKDIHKGNRELLLENHLLEARVKELNNELMRTYRNCDVTPCLPCLTMMANVLAISRGLCEHCSRRWVLAGPHSSLAP
jgi:hypothetical protein